MIEIAATHTDRHLFLHHVILIVLTIACSIMWVKISSLKKKLRDPGNHK
ncbi:MAG: hypothetical protein ABI688_00625 [Bacteroidota bacterium]